MNAHVRTFDDPIADVRRILRPRQFVPTPPEWVAHGRVSERFDGKRHWVNRWPHPEIADLVERCEALMSSDRMTDAERAVSDRVEQLFLYAEFVFAWWFERIDHGRLMPDSADRPEPEAVIGQMPSWETFFALLGAIHRARAWIEAVERRRGIEREAAASVWARAYGVSVAEIERVRRG